MIALASLTLLLLAVPLAVVMTEDNCSAMVLLGYNLQPEFRLVAAERISDANMWFVVNTFDDLLVKDKLYSSARRTACIFRLNINVGSPH